MSENSNYQGPLGEHLQAFIEEKQNLGCRYVREMDLAHLFDQMSLNYDCSNGLSRELVEEFTRMQPNWQATTQMRRISFVNNFGTYLLRHNINAYKPGTETVKNLKPVFKPYIFSHEEIQILFDLADQIRPNNRNSHIFYPVLYRTLYGTGMRISEALNLKMKDVDLTEKTILVENPKNRKDRKLPISDSLAEYCLWYQKKVHPAYHLDDYFFMSNGKENGQYHRNNVQIYFTTLINRANFPYHGYKDRNGSPHLHSLRHTFCVHSLAKLLEEGVPHGAALQLLCTYMGHQSLSATGRYLQLTAEAFPDLKDQIEAATSDLFPQINPLGGASVR